MSADQETVAWEEFQRITELVPASRGHIHPPLSLVARVWALMDVPAGEDRFTYAESHQEGDVARTTWTIVVADNTHLVHVQASVPSKGWARMPDFLSLSRVEENIDATSRRLSFDALTEVRSAGAYRDWLTAGSPPQAPAWDLRWGSDFSIRLPVYDDRLAHNARALVLGLRRR